jgi:hypothetical protein
VSKNDTEAKSNDPNDYALLHWLFPAITFLIGFLIGYEPAGRDKIKSPNDLGNRRPATTDFQKGDKA